MSSLKNYIDKITEMNLSQNQLISFAARCMAREHIAVTKLKEQYPEAYDAEYQDAIKEFSSQAIKVSKSEAAKKSIQKKLENDPKQKWLKEIEKHYEAVKNQFKRRGYSAQFIREMSARYPKIDSQKTIQNLVTKLNKKNELIPR